MVLSLLSLLYILCALLLTLHALGTAALLLVYWRTRHQTLAPPPVENWPRVAVQLPVYNEHHVIQRLLAAVAALDYPRELLTVQVLDDSVDDTSALIRQALPGLRAGGLDIRHIRRAQRSGYKAGALARGLELLDCELLAVLDADFVPPPDFLRRTVPHLVADEQIGMVQTRWGHLNWLDNALTRGQALALDGHFIIEQTARNRAGWFMNFSGSGGVWRVACIRESGGWSALTLTEDLDLSYRAQLAGWRFLYLPDVVVPAEVPPQIAAWKQQQARWARGSTRTLLGLLRPLWRAPLRPGQRIMATLHLCQYLPHPLMLLMLLLTPLLLLGGRFSALLPGPLGLLALVPALLYVLSQYALYPDWQRRLRAFPLLLLLGTGMTLNATLAVLAGLIPGRAEFRRTPKFARSRFASRYALRVDHTLVGELLLAAYALAATLIALAQFPALVPWLALYSLAFALVAGLSLRDQWLLFRLRP